MGKMLLAYGQVLGIVKKDKVIIIFSMIPILLGLILFYFLGDFIFTDLVNFGKVWIDDQVGGSTWGAFLQYILIGILLIAFYFMLSWFFVLIISILASPFNDAISKRVETQILGEEIESFSDSFKEMVNGFGGTIWNEIKKVMFIIFLAVLAFALSLIPLLAPISLILSALLLAIGFLDYSWSRHQLTFASCLNDLRKSLLTYGLSGVAFMFVVAIPFLNLIVLPFATIYYTILFCHHQNKSEA